MLRNKFALRGNHLLQILTVIDNCVKGLSQIKFHSSLRAQRLPLFCHVGGRICSEDLLTFSMEQNPS
jgi:hypothetical protein